MATREERERQDARVAKFWRDKEATLYGADCYCDERIGDCDACKAVASRKVDKVPDRVIDAPIPEHIDAMLPKDLAIYCIELEARIARLEAERQEAHTEGWNAAIEKVIDKSHGFGRNTAEGWGVQHFRHTVRALSKPTAAKQGDPS